MRKLLFILFALLLASCLAGCQKSSKPDAAPAAIQTISMTEYLASVKAQSDVIKASLEQDVLTQADMNQKSKELCDLWDKALSLLMDEAAKVLSSDEMTKLTEEQTAWLKTRTEAMEAAGKEFEGGSMYALVVNSEDANLTQARVYEIYERLK